jgi:hypothetical protein
MRSWSHLEALGPGCQRRSSFQELPVGHPVRPVPAHPPRLNSAVRIGEAEVTPGDAEPVTRAVAAAIRTTPPTKGSAASRGRETSPTKAASAVTWGRAPVRDRTASFVIGALVCSFVTAACASRTAGLSPRTADLSFVESAISLRDDELTVGDASVSILSSASRKATVPGRRLTAGRPIVTAAVRILRFDLGFMTDTFPVLAVEPSTRRAKFSDETCPCGSASHGSPRKQASTRNRLAVRSFSISPKTGSPLVGSAVTGWSAQR